MFSTALRLLARGGNLKASSSSVPRSRSSLGRTNPINPKVDIAEAYRLADILHNILNQNGPLTVANCWTHAQALQGVGFKSKRHMKTMLKWMKERSRVKLIGNYSRKKKEEEDSFRYAVFYHNPDVLKTESLEKK